MTDWSVVACFEGHVSSETYMLISGMDALAVII